LFALAKTTRSFAYRKAREGKATLRSFHWVPKIYTAFFFYELSKKVYAMDE